MIIHEQELAKIPDIKAKALHYVFEQEMVSDKGLWLEFGVYQAGALNRIAKWTDKPIIFGFDSFEGLPEVWERPDAWMGKWDVGSFNLNGKMPHVPPHVQLIKGWYKDTLPIFADKMRRNGEFVSFIHIDSDIYSSCSTVLNELTDLIADDSIIVFDELVGYQNFEKHEWKAWWEFVESRGVIFEWIGGNSSRVIDTIPPIKGLKFDADRTPSGLPAVSPSWENVAVRIKKNPSFGNR